MRTGIRNNSKESSESGGASALFHHKYQNYRNNKSRMEMQSRRNIDRRHLVLRDDRHKLMKEKYDSAYEITKPPLPGKGGSQSQVAGAFVPPT